MVAKLAIPARQYDFYLELQRRMSLYPDKFPTVKYGSFENVCKRTQQLKQAYKFWLEDAKYKGVDTSLEENEISKKEEELKKAYGSKTAKIVQANKELIAVLNENSAKLAQTIEKSKAESGEHNASNINSESESAELN